MKVKICGVTTVADALLCEQLGADYIGLNFAARSPRCLDSDSAKQITAVLKRSKTVGVFVDTPIAEVISLAKAINLAAIQVYYPVVEKVKELTVIQAIAVEGKQSLVAMADSAADYFLLDASHDGKFGGLGLQFDWSLLPEKKDRLFLAGGIGPENVTQAAAEQVYAIDLCSGVESAPGIKDEAKLISVFNQLKEVQ